MSSEDKGVAQRNEIAGLAAGGPPCWRETFQWASSLDRAERFELVPETRLGEPARGTHRQKEVERVVRAAVWRMLDELGYDWGKGLMERGIHFTVDTYTWNMLDGQFTSVPFQIEGHKLLRLVLCRAGLTQPPLFEGEDHVPTEAELTMEALLNRPY